MKAFSRTVLRKNVVFAKSMNSVIKCPSFPLGPPNEGLVHNCASFADHFAYNDDQEASKEDHHEEDQLSGFFMNGARAS